ncbi:MAG TPA: hypothetical protein VFY82_01485 [Acidimicrobiales bacterium]|nr:hypothetical protein [Acidimicrobiales bacterium]
MSARPDSGPIVVIGGSIAGLTSALLFARTGRQVVLVERDPATAAARLAGLAGRDVPARRTTPQSDHSHIFLARLRLLLAERAPDALAALVAHGVRELALRDGLPPGLVGVDHPALDDPALVALAARRTTIEEALRAVVLAEPGVVQRSGAAAHDLVVEGPSDAGPATVRGVVFADGSALGAGLVVDASGRRTAVPGWLAARGVAADVESAECGISYLSRFYRAHDGCIDPPLTRGFTAGGSFDGWSCLVFPGDDGTFSVTFGILPEDRGMRALAASGPAFDAAVAAIPSLAPWTDPAHAAPITGVATMSGLKNMVRRYVDPATGEPSVLGLATVGDAAATGNPAHSRGCTVAAVHAAAIADAVAAHGDDPVALAAALDDVMVCQVRPWVQDSVDQDAVRLARWRPGTPPAPAPAPDRLTNGELYAAAQSDPELWRTFSRLQNMLHLPAEVLADAATVTAVRDGTFPSPPGVDAPSRPELLALAAGADARPGRRRRQVAPAP